MDYLKYAKDILSKKGQSTSSNGSSTLDIAVSSLLKSGILYDII